MCQSLPDAMKAPSVALLALVVAGCSDSGGVSLTWGDPALSVTEGANQVAEAAAADSLDQPVRARLYQTASGGITFRVVPELHAQSAANVRGVPGHQVCAVPIGATGLQPWNPCASTNGEGYASFFFEPGTRAGKHCAEIRAVVEDQKVVSETVCAEVEAGPVEISPTWRLESANTAWGDPFYFPLGSMFGFVDAHYNEFPFTIEASGAFSVQYGGPANGYGIAPIGGASYGDTGVIRFLRNGKSFLDGRATLLPGQTEASWGLLIERI